MSDISIIIQQTGPCITITVTILVILNIQSVQIYVLQWMLNNFNIFVTGFHMAPKLSKMFPE